MPRTCAPRPTRGTRATYAAQRPDRACPPVAGGVQGQARHRTYRARAGGARGALERRQVTRAQGRADHLEFKVARQGSTQLQRAAGVAQRVAERGAN
eukprot:1689827-Pyramimonas_sp.AAC.1